MILKQLMLMCGYPNKNVYTPLESGDPKISKLTYCERPFDRETGVDSGSMCI